MGDELRAVLFTIAEVEKQRNELRRQVELRDQELVRTQAAIDEELRIRCQLEARHNSCQRKVVREFGVPCATACSSGIRPLPSGTSRLAADSTRVSSSRQPTTSARTDTSRVAASPATTARVGTGSR